MAFLSRVIAKALRSIEVISVVDLRLLSDVSAFRCVSSTMRCRAFK